jgi:hypothetical protein
MSLSSTKDGFAHLPGRELGIVHDRPDPWEEFSIVPLYLGNPPTLPIPRLGLIPEIKQLGLNSAFGTPRHETGQIQVNEPVQLSN